MYAESRMEHEISIQDFRKLWDRQSADSSAPLYPRDVRQPGAAETAAIAGSRLIPMNEIPARAQQELNPDAHIVVYCHHGQRSLGVVMWLREQGFPRSQSLAGGIDAWSQAVDPFIPRY